MMHSSCYELVRFPKLEAGKVAYVYALKEVGSDEPKYIGITTEPIGRMRSHLNIYNVGATDRKKQWIQSVGRDRVVMEILCIAEHDEALRIESRTYPLTGGMLND